MRRTWPFLLAVVVISAAVGAALARGGGHDSFVLAPTSVVTSTSVEVQSGAPVPGAARTRVVIAGADAAQAQGMLDLVAALGYPEAQLGSSLVAGPAVYYREGFADAAAELATNLHLNVDAQSLSQVVTDADSAGDVIVILGT